MENLLNGLKKDLEKITGKGVFKLQVDVAGGSVNHDLFTAMPNDRKFPHGMYYVKKDNGTSNPDMIASWTLVQLPACCGICISHSARVYGRYLNKGLGRLFNRFRLEMAKNMGYGLMLATDIKNHEVQRKILAKNGWKDIHTFVNPRTSNELAISVVDLLKAV